jgi:uncharacterized protein (UPF0335 family)
MVGAPTHGELLRTVADLMKENQAERAEFQATVDRLEKRVDRLEQENQTLRSRLDKDSKNSLKPPSSDSFRKPASRDRSLRESSVVNRRGNRLAVAVFRCRWPPVLIGSSSTSHLHAVGAAVRWNIFLGSSPHVGRSLMCRRSRWKRWSINEFRNGARVTLTCPLF